MLVRATNPSSPTMRPCSESTNATSYRSRLGKVGITTPAQLGSLEPSSHQTPSGGRLGVGVTVGVDVTVGVFVTIDVAVGVLVDVVVGVAVTALSVGVGVNVWATVAVRLGVGVEVGVGVTVVGSVVGTSIRRPIQLFAIIGRWTCLIRDVGDADGVIVGVPVAVVVHVTDGVTVREDVTVEVGAVGVTVAGPLGWKRMRPHPLVPIQTSPLGATLITSMSFVTIGELAGSKVRVNVVPTMSLMPPVARSTMRSSSRPTCSH